MSVFKIVLIGLLRLTLTMSLILSSAVPLIVLQVLLYILFVDSRCFYTTATTSESPPLSSSPDNEDEYYDDHTDTIVGGESTYDGEFPFMAALGWINKFGNLSFHGAGMVISPKMILTAAHCVYLDGKVPDIVYLGGESLTEDEDEPSEEILMKYSVANVTIFPKYDTHQGYHDIAILELNASTSFPPICLWPSDNLNISEVTAIGYGLTEFAGSGSQDLLKVNLTVFSSDYCAPFFKRQRKFKSGISNTHICAGDKDGKKDTCQGDSGGPLIVNYDYITYAVGITSSGQACSGFPPAIYTKIYPYIEWITSVLEERGQYLKSCALSDPEDENTFIYL